MRLEYRHSGMDFDIPRHAELHMPRCGRRQGDAKLHAPTRKLLQLRRPFDLDPVFPFGCDNQCQPALLVISQRRRPVVQNRARQTDLGKTKRHRHRSFAQGDDLKSTGQCHGIPCDFCKILPPSHLPQLDRFRGPSGGFGGSQQRFKLGAVHQYGLIRRIDQMGQILVGNVNVRLQRLGLYQRNETPDRQHKNHPTCRMGNLFAHAAY